MRRRSFLATPGLAALAAGSKPDIQNSVIATGDGIPHSPVEYSELLQKCAAGAHADSFSLGGIVAQLEQKVALALGKEFAVWLPTGTLANHLAVRLLAGEKRRVLLQQESHLFNDCGDCCQTLSGLHLVPLAPDKATFTLEDVQHEVDRSVTGRVSVPIGAIQIETPVRRKSGELFDVAEMQRISHWARSRQIGLHLDGARLFIAAAYSKVSVQEYSALFDTVYVSMYKYFNAASGAVLAGPKSLLENLFHTRRMFGGGLNQSWPLAAVALHYFDGFQERYARAVAASEDVKSGLAADKRFEVRQIPNGSNIFSLQVKGISPETYQQRCREAGFTLAAPEGSRFLVRVNETWNRSTSQAILDRLRTAAV